MKQVYEITMPTAFRILADDELDAYIQFKSHISGGGSPFFIRPVEGEDE